MALERSAQIAIWLPQSEKEFIQEAARASGTKNLTAFSRQLLVEQAEQILGRKYVSVRAQQPSNHTQRDMLGVVSELGMKDKTVSPVCFPSLRYFATVLSDRERAVLRYLANNEPKSISALADEFEYCYPTVLRKINQLNDLGLTSARDLEQQEKVPVLLCRSLKLVLPLREKLAAQHKLFCVGIKGELNANEDSELDARFDSMEELAHVISDRTVGLMRLIDRKKPASVADIGRETGHSKQNYYLVIRKLRKLGLLESSQGGTRVRPAVKYDGIYIKLRFSGFDGDDKRAI